VSGIKLAVSLLLVLAPAIAWAEPWPSWRGPGGIGQTQHKDLPLHWDAKTKTNILWKAALVPLGAKVQLDQNQSSPIVQGEHAFVTLSWWPADRAKDKFPEHHVICLGTRDGQLLWDTTVPPGPWLLKDLRGGYTAPTPATDGQRVYTLFGSAVLAALDLRGKLLWRKPIEPYQFDVCIGTSPVLYKDTVLLLCDQQNKKSFLRAFDCATGEIRHEVQRPFADWTHSTPVIAQVGGRTQLLVAGSNAVEGLDPASGERLWWCSSAKRIGDTPSVVLSGNVLFSDSGRGGPGMAVDPTGQGDVTKTHLKWSISNIPEGFSSPVIVGEYLYRLCNPGVLKCWDLASGKQVYAERLEGVSSSSSPITTPDGRIYCASGGRSYVVRAGGKCEILAVNDLGDASQASPAVADGRVYLKGRDYLWCVGEK
jgi:outer membrane protein assembly factor BamB